MPAPAASVRSDPPVLALRAVVRGVDRATHVERLREARSVHPRDGVADLEAGVFDRACQPVVGAGASEREQMPAGCQDPEGFTGPCLMPLLHCPREPPLVAIINLAGWRPIRFGATARVLIPLPQAA